MPEVKVSEVRGMNIPYVVLVAACLWTAALGLAVWSTLTAEEVRSGPGALWSILTAAAAASSTVLAGQCIGRKRTVRAIVGQLELREEAQRLTRI